jgi:membrane protein implicated in regulation of membrane protease activity
VGAKRYVDARGTVTETVDPFTGEGRIRVETEEWRATTDLDQVIEIGTPVIVLEVRGSRMVIEPAQIH